MQDNKMFVDNLQVNISNDVASGTYSNLVAIAHSFSEVVLDFAQVLPGSNTAQVRSRVIMAPNHAKRLMWALQENITKYEDAFGEIKEPTPPSSGNTIPFDMDLLGKA